MIIYVGHYAVVCTVLTFTLLSIKIKIIYYTFTCVLIYVPCVVYREHVREESTSGTGEKGEVLMVSCILYTNNHHHFCHILVIDTLKDKGSSVC